MSNELDRDRAALAAAIRAEAAARGMTLAQLAKRAGIPGSTMDTYMSGTDIKLGRFRAIATALGMSPQALMDRADYWESQLFRNGRD